MSKAKVGIFEKPREASIAVDKLIASGVSKERISVMAPDSVTKESLGIEEQTKGAEGATVGGSIGAATLGIVAGLTSVGTLATGGTGLLVAGPLVAALTGAGAGAVAGGVLGGLVGLGFSEHEVKHFEDALEKGSVLVAVDMDDADDEDAIEDILNQSNAREVSTA
jgi:hypothetical protein